MRGAGKELVRKRLLEPQFTSGHPLKTLGYQIGSQTPGSLRQIATVLNEKGVPTKAGGLRWCASTVPKVLENDLHTHGDVPKAA
jgi:hypothetical protein